MFTMCEVRNSLCVVHSISSDSFPKPCCYQPSSFFSRPISPDITICYDPWNTSWVPPQAYYNILNLQRFCPRLVGFFLSFVLQMLKAFVTTLQNVNSSRIANKKIHFKAVLSIRTLHVSAHPLHGSISMDLFSCQHQSLVFH